MYKHKNKRIAFFQPATLVTASAFAGFYERTHLHVFRYLFGLTGGPQQDVEDLAADTFTRAWRARRSFTGDDQAALGWVLKIARRLVIDDYRRRSSRPVAEESLPAATPAIDPLPEELAWQGEEQQRLWALLLTLPEAAREMLTLRYLLGWRVNEIARYLAIPENSVSATIHRSLERLRRAWLLQVNDPS